MKIFNTIIILLSSIYLVFGDSSLSLAAQPNQTQCPVMGNTVNKKIYTDYGGQADLLLLPTLHPGIQTGS